MLEVALVNVKFSFRNKNKILNNLNECHFSYSLGNLYGT